MTNRMKRPIIAALLASAPLAWGFFIWYTAFGPGQWLALSYPVKALLGTILASTFFYTRQRHKKHDPVYLFNWRLTLPKIQHLCMMKVIILLCYLLYSQYYAWHEYPFIDSFVFVVIASAYLEELLTHALFVIQKMSVLEFVFWNFITSATFTLMHAGFVATPPALSTLFFTTSHFHYSFLLGIIAYKAQRIEISILFHALSNLLRYTLPKTLIGHDIPALSLALTCFELLFVGYIHTKQKS